MSRLAAKYILVLLGALFLVFAAIRVAREHGHIGPASRTWLIVGCVFLLVSLWLWLQ